MTEDPLRCTRCGLCETRKNVVIRRGLQMSTFIIVGEAPGEDEDKQGLPFVGRCGRLLDKCLRAAGIPPEATTITNVVRCRPTSRTCKICGTLHYYVEEPSREMVATEEEHSKKTVRVSRVPSNLRSSIDATGKGHVLRSALFRTTPGTSRGTETRSPTLAQEETTPNTRRLPQGNDNPGSQRSRRTCASSHHGRDSGTQVGALGARTPQEQNQDRQPTQESRDRPSTITPRTSQVSPLSQALSCDVAGHQWEASKNRNPTEVEVATCTYWLDQFLRARRPHVIVALGRFSIGYFQGYTYEHTLKMKVRPEIGRFFTSLKTPHCETQVIGSWHPGYGLRAGGAVVEELIDHLRQAREQHNRLARHL
jgi:uracil-DNA glycosylase